MYWLGYCQKFYFTTSLQQYTIKELTCRLHIFYDLMADIHNSNAKTKTE